MSFLVGLLFFGAFVAFVCASVGAPVSTTSTVSTSTSISSFPSTATAAPAGSVLTGCFSEGPGWGPVAAATAASALLRMRVDLRGGPTGTCGFAVTHRAVLVRVCFADGWAAISASAVPRLRFPHCVDFWSSVNRWRLDEMNWIG